MKQVFPAILLSFLSFSCKQNPSTEKIAAVNFDTTYRPAVFTDANRPDDNRDESRR